MRSWNDLGFALAISGCTACAAGAPPRLNYAELTSSAMGHPMQYALYLPPHWTREEQLPLVVFLHGSGDGPNAFDHAGIGQLLDKADVPRAVIVAPQGDRGFWENWATGDHSYREWVMRELVPTIQQQYNTKPCPAGCHVLGISMGGYGALMFALREPGTFASVSALSAPIYTPDSVKQFYDSLWWSWLLPIEDIWGPYNPSRIAERDLYRRWQSAADLKGSSLLLAWGEEEDSVLKRDNARFERHLQQRNIPHVTLRFSGGHEWTAWRPVILEALRLQLRPRSDVQ